MNNLQERISKEEVNKLPLRAFDGKIYTINKSSQLKSVIPLLENQKLLGFDTETRPVFKKHVYREVALLQLSTKDEAFLFRLNKIGLPQELTAILSNPKIIKAGVAIRDDIKELRQRTEFKPGGFVELQTFVNKYGIQDAGLKKLTGNILQFRISKSEQLSNWEKTRLSSKQKKYAATDAWVGYMIYSELTNSYE